ncbi:MAG TPA: methyltransferase domain-containing protein [Candidatus Babeliales bacterium]|nr:methyltransferase domain-containing protein [Candidatus Babeliales bacterium]
MNLELIKIFDQLSGRYDSWFDRHQAVFQSELNAIKKVLPESGVGLQVGVASGRFAAALGIKIGVDPSSKLREIAKSRGINVFDSVAEMLPFPSEEFDFVLLSTVLCYLDSVLNAFAEAKRVLKPGGIFIVSVIDRHSALGQFYESKKGNNPFYRHAHFYTVDEIITLMNQVGFSQKEIYQTIFSDIRNIKLPEPVKPGYGKGGFVVISAVDRLYGYDAEVP